MTNTTAQVHRFHDAVACYLGDGQTVYLSAQQARAIGAALTACAADVEACDYLGSQFATIEWTNIDQRANRALHIERG